MKQTLYLSFKIELPKNALQDFLGFIIYQDVKKILPGHRVFLSYLSLKFS